ncbi:MAG TPA: hypothetical protein VFZ38_10705 [Vicinamibacterales bacterium]
MERAATHEELVDNFMRADRNYSTFPHHQNYIAMNTARNVLLAKFAKLQSEIESVRAERNRCFEDVDIALATKRKEVIEECARVVERMDITEAALFAKGSHNSCALTRKLAATAIRALKSQEPQP